MKLSMEPSISGCNVGCSLLIQNTHTHFHGLTAQYGTYYFVYLSAGELQTIRHARVKLPSLESEPQQVAKSSVLLLSDDCWGRTTTETPNPFCTFYLQNVLKFSVQRLTNEVQQISMRLLLFCTHYYAPRGHVLFFFLLQKVRRIQKRNKGKKNIRGAGH